MIAAVFISTATINDGVLINQDVFGFKNARTQTPVSTSTKFQAASLSKTVNAVAILTLVNRGVISIESAVNKYLTSWRLQVNVE